MMRRIIAILLAVLMVVQVMPLAALAETLQNVEAGFQSVESNDIKGLDVEEVFEITFELDDEVEQTEQTAVGNGKGKGKGKLLSAKSNNGKGNAESNGRSANARLRRSGEKIGKLPDAPQKKHLYGWVDKKNKRYVTEDTVVTGSMSLSPIGTNEEDLSLSDNGVSVEVPTDSVPENAEFSAALVSADRVQEAVESIVGEVGEIRAVDMTFTDKNINQEVEPAKPVEVTMSVAGMNTDALVVIHIKDDGSRENIPFSLNGNNISFTAVSFSIYAVVEDLKIITVNFFDGEGNHITSEYIRKIDDEVQNLYNPSFELEYGESFKGWMDSEGVLSEDIDKLNETIEDNWNTLSAAEPLDYYAVVKQAYVITYNQYKDGESVELYTEKVDIDADSKVITIWGKPETVSEEDFKGWLGQDGKTYQPGNQFTVNGHFSFILKEGTHKWLVFDANAGGPGSGATYTPPQLILSSETLTVEPDEPTRPGYTFLGWNSQKDGSGDWWGTYYTVDAAGNKTSHAGNKQFGGTLTNDTNLFAQWKGVQTSYYVIFWKQKADATGTDKEKDYIYAESVARTAITGDPVSITNDDKKKGGTTGSSYGYFFTFNEANSDINATVEANGTTQLNVYYDRREITYIFKYVNNEIKTTSGYDLVRIRNGNSYKYAIKIDDVWHEISSNGYRVWETSQIIRVSNGSIQYRRNNNNNNYVYYSTSAYTFQEDESFTGFYQSAFTEWPDAGTGATWMIGGTSFPLAITVFDPAVTGDNSKDTTINI